MLINYIKSKKKIIEKNDRLQIFFDTAFEGIAITKEGKFIDGNDRFFDMFGYTKEEMINMPVKNLVHKDDLALVQKRMREGYSEPYKHKCIHKNGSVRFVEVHGRTIKHKGEILRLTAIHDITYSKKHEEDRIKLKYHQNQISKLELIGSFAGGIVHDFNNALLPIIGNCDIILYEMNRDTEGCQVHKKNIMSIMQAAETAKTLVNRIQSFARKNGEEQLALNLSDCIKESFAFLKVMIPKEVEVELNIETTSEMVMANEVTIKQILMNLCKNSVQSMQDNKKGKISINVTNKKFDKKQFEISKGEYIKIEIIDNGKGMSPKVMERAFDPYFTTKKEGTGIGLSIVGRIIRNYHGFIRLYSKVNKGTLVIIYIPVLSQ
jgi:PAS domain S-box-containing protein